MLLLIYKLLEIGFRILHVFVCISCARGSFLHVSGGNPDLEYIKTTSSALAETVFDPEAIGGFFPPSNDLYNQ